MCGVSDNRHSILQTALISIKANTEMINGFERTSNTVFLLHQSCLNPVTQSC